MRCAARGLALLALVWCLLHAGLASAQRGRPGTGPRPGTGGGTIRPSGTPSRPSPRPSAQQQEYKEHLTAAERAARNQNWTAALAEYSAANAIARGADTLEGLANAHRQLGHLADAHAAYTELARDFSGTLSPTRRAAVEGHLREIAQRSGVVTLIVAEADATLMLDAQNLGVGPLAKALRLPVGEYALRLTKPGYRPMERKVNVAAGSTTTLALPNMTVADSGGGPAGAGPSTGQPSGSQAGGPPAREGGGPPAGGPSGEEGKGERAGSSWQADHGSQSYRAVRTKVAPKIDGLLDDEVWKRAPQDNRFYSTRSLPYGQRTTEPTVVQLAFDSLYIYVAFRSSYSSPGDRDDNVAPDEQTLDETAETVRVLIDGRHDHSSDRIFGVSRMGQRVDIDRSQNGQVDNVAWQGVWDVAVTKTQSWWVAEMAIPWSTAGAESHRGAFDIGISFERDVPRANEDATWALHPPDAPSPPSFFGHATGFTDNASSLRLFISPYASAFVADPAETTPFLRDFLGTAGNAGIYGGFYARYRPGGPYQVDATFNPDFSQVAPDQALTNLDRFELERREVRPFFSEDLPRFEFGADARSGLYGRLFYSRRIGLRPTESGLREAPIVYGAKGVVRVGGSEVAAMNVESSGVGRRLELMDNVTIVRANHSFGSGHRIGNLIMVRRGDVSDHAATGIDGAVSFFDQHAVLSGYAAGTATKGRGKGFVAGGLLAWSSDDFKVSAAYQEVSRDFDPQLGFFRAVGVRDSSFSGAYTPRLNNDLVQQVELSANVLSARTLDGDLLYNRGTGSFNADLVNGGSLTVAFAPFEEGVLRSFNLAGGRIPVAAGRYSGLVSSVAVRSPPRRRVEFGIGYEEGDLFGGHQRAPIVDLGLNVGRLSVRADSRLFFLRGGNGIEVSGTQLALQGVFAYTPFARTTLAVQANTLDPVAIAQLVNSIRFGLLSQLALVLRQDAPTVDKFAARADRRAVLTFTYGISPF